jgi:hypothetical protein
VAQILPHLTHAKPSGFSGRQARPGASLVTATTIKILDQGPGKEKTLPKQGSLLELIGLSRDRGEFSGVDIDEPAVLTLVLETDNAVDLSEKGVVLAAANIGARLERSSALTDNDASTEDRLTAEYLDAEPLSV